MRRANLLDVDAALAQSQPLARRALASACAQQGMDTRGSAAEYRELRQVSAGKERIGDRLRDRGRRLGIATTPSDARVDAPLRDLGGANGRERSSGRGAGEVGAPKRPSPQRVGRCRARCNIAPAQALAGKDGAADGAAAHGGCRHCRASGSEHG